MFSRIHTKRLIKKAAPFDRETLSCLECFIRDDVKTKGFSLIAIAGSPGTGKSTCARYIAERGFLSFAREQIMVIDDLRNVKSEKDFGYAVRGARYRSRELPGLVGQLENKVLFLFDFKAARYLKKVDILILLHVDESERLKNLRSRSERGYKRYNRRMYRTPPIPLGFRSERAFVCRESLLNILRGQSC